MPNYGDFYQHNCTSCGLPCDCMAFDLDACHWCSDCNRDDMDLDEEDE